MLKNEEASAMDSSEESTDEEIDPYNWSEQEEVDVTLSVYSFFFIKISVKLKNTFFLRKFRTLFR